MSTGTIKIRETKERDKERLLTKGQHAKSYTHPGCSLLALLRLVQTLSSLLVHLLSLDHIPVPPYITLRACSLSSYFESSKGSKFWASFLANGSSLSHRRWSTTPRVKNPPPESPLLSPEAYLPKLPVLSSISTYIDI